mmetsp:Transcript_5960/g.13455  ORF Transcript_5960/g.13455 Transcript_5960/m.13455 type:complete len:143 (+) Transcript_5960:1714-2142(+)
MRSGRHFAKFTGLTGEGWIGVIRPVQINKSDLNDGELDTFSPGLRKFWRYKRNQRTERWCDFDDQCVEVKKRVDWTKIHGFRRGDSIGLLLDLNEGTLSIYIYKNGSLVTSEEKKGLLGEYCWYAVVKNSSISIKRDLVPSE